MDLPERFSDLPDYAFPRLRALLAPHKPGGPEVAMSIGEPQHPFPSFVPDALAEAMGSFGKYPVNDGSALLLEAITAWVARRYGVNLPPERVMALNGTREGLYNAMMALAPESRPLVLLPNPFYQVYAVAALSVGAEPYYVNATAETGFLPDFASLPAEVLDRASVVYICSPSNPQGAVAGRDYLAELLRLSEKHGFRVFADECYSEIYRDTPPPGILEVAAAEGADPEKVVAFHSLSKRSNLPGLRSGFLAGGPASVAACRRLRAYAGAPLPGPLQAVAARVWADEAHVDENRAAYRAKYRIADEILAGVPGYQPPEAGFFLWLNTGDGEAAAVKLWRETGIRTLPGAYFSRDTATGNPGAPYLRVAMVAPVEVLTPALTALKSSLYG